MSQDELATRIAEIEAQKATFQAAFDSARKSGHQLSAYFLFRIKRCDAGIAGLRRLYG